MKKELIHEKREFADVRELLEWASREYADSCLFSYRHPTQKGETKRKTFAQFGEDVRALASSLLKMGCAGKHCAVIGKLSYDWAVTYYAVLSIGGVLVPLDKDWNAEDLADTVLKSDAEFLFCDDELADKAEVIVRTAGIKTEPVLLLAPREQSNSLKAMVGSGRAIFKENPDAYYQAPIDPNKLSLLVFTSGTTGKGKGVMLSQHAVLSDLSSVIPYIDFSKKTVGVLPPHHTYGSSVMLIGHVMIGSEIYISAGLRTIQKELKEQKPGHLILVPLYLETFYRKILANVREQGKEKLLRNMIKLSNALRKVGIDRRRQFFSSVRAAFGGEVSTIISGGAPINPDILDFFDAIGISTLNGYGITECAPIIAVNRSRRIVPGSVGNVLDIDTVKIDAPDGNGEGEILVKGENVMLGYYKDEAATADAFDDEGYFRTGDYGRLTDDGILYITGRKKNLIILSNGKNVYPEEIENELIAVPGVLEIVVYEGQSRRGLEHNAIVAEIFPDAEYVKKNGIEDVKAYIKKYVDAYNKTAVPYKKITVIKIRKEEFPKNTLRKIMRFKLDMSID